jgi:hypothetical protein
VQWRIVDNLIAQELNHNSVIRIVCYKSMIN